MIMQLTLPHVDVFPSSSPAEKDSLKTPDVPTTPVNDSQQYVFNAIVEFEIQRELRRWDEEIKEWDHAKQRAYDRYGIILEDEDRELIAWQIIDGQSNCIRKDNGHRRPREQHILRCQGQICRVVVAVQDYSVDGIALVTFLPLSRKQVRRFKNFEKWNRKRRKQRFVIASE